MSKDRLRRTPFELGDNSRIAVKIVNCRGVESLKVVEVDPNAGENI